MSKIATEFVPEFVTNCEKAYVQWNKMVQGFNQVIRNSTFLERNVNLILYINTFLINKGSRGEKATHQTKPQVLMQITVH